MADLRDAVEPVCVTHGRHNHNHSP
jgi:hypothetical protein